MHNPQIGCIILARFNSHRLPGKALMTVSGKPILLHIFETLSDFLRKDEIVIATSSSPTDDPIENFCTQQQIHCYRGSLDLVAERFYNCAKHHSFDYAFRINGDNLFVESRCIHQMITDINDQQEYDFLTNVKGRTFPFGMSVELLKTEFYGKHLTDFRHNLRYQEHVTLYLYDKEEIGKRKYYYNTEFPEAKGVHVAIDTPKDLKIAQLIFELMPEPGNMPPLPDLISYYQQAKKQYELSLER